MLKNYLKTAFRNLIRHRTFSFINLLGLTVGLSTFLFIVLWIRDEVTYDRFNKNLNDLYEVYENQTYSANMIYTFKATPGPLAEAMQAEFPEVAHKTQLLSRLVEEDYDIEDPYGSSLEEYQLCADDIERILKAGFAQLNQLAAAPAVSHPDVAQQEDSL